MTRKLGSFWMKIAALEFTSALVIVAATRAYVLGSYSMVAATEVIFVMQWFYSRNLPFSDKRSRSWKLGFPAYLDGSMAGALAGLWISKKLGY